MNIYIERKLNTKLISKHDSRSEPAKYLALKIQKVTIILVIYTFIGILGGSETRMELKNYCFEEKARNRKGGTKFLFLVSSFREAYRMSLLSWKAKWSGTEKSRLLGN